MTLDQHKKAAKESEKFSQEQASKFELTTDDLRQLNKPKH